MQPACGSVGTSPELAAGVQLGHHEFDPGQSGLLLHVNGDPPAVVGDLHTPIGQHRHGHRVAMPGQRLIDSVVDDLPHAVHQPARVRRPDVHARTLTDSIQALKDRQCIGGVRGGFCGHLSTLEPGYDNYV